MILIMILIMTHTQGCQKAPATGNIAGYSEVFAGYELSRKSGKIKKTNK